MVTALTIRTLLQTNQTDLLYSLCQLLEWYCRQIKQTYCSPCVNYQNGIVDKPNRSIIVPVLTIRRVLQTNQTDLLLSMSQLLERFCRKIKQTNHRYCVNYQKDIVDKSETYYIVPVLTIIMVLQKNQTDLLQSLC